MAMLRLREDEDEFPETHDINVTPFIDVMLVLLIVFMIAAPLSTVSVPLELPVSSATAAEPPAAPIVLSIQADESWSIGDNRIDHGQLSRAIDALSKGDHQTRIFIRADKSVSYQHLMDGMNALRDQGYLKVSLVGVQDGSPP